VLIWLAGAALTRACDPAVLRQRKKRKPNRKLKFKQKTGINAGFLLFYLLIQYHKNRQKFKSYEQDRNALKGNFINLDIL
jgi:hypothetical protein